MRLLCTVLALALWGCHGWPKETPDRSLGLKHDGSRRTRAKDVKGAQTARRVPEESPTLPHQSSSGGQHGFQAGRGQCLVNGMAMFDGAAWAPNPCTMCICDRGRQVCEPMDCEAVKCPAGRLQTPPAGCCPICTETATSPKDVSTPGRPRHGAVSAEKKGKVKGKAERESSVHEEVLPKKKTVPSSSTLKKEAPEKKQGGTSSKQGAAIGKDPAAARVAEGAPKKTLVTTGAPRQEASTQGKHGGSARGQEVVAAKEEAGNKRREAASPKTQEVGKPSNTPEEVQRRLDTKEVVVEKRPAPERRTKEELQRMKPLKAGEEGHHPGTKEDKAGEESEGPFDPASRLAALPTPETEMHMPSLPTGCLLAESTIACANTKLRHVPVLTDLGLKTLYLAENEISQLPGEAFSGLPNLEWLDLSKNKLDDAGVHMDVFKNLTKLKRLNLDGNRLTGIPPLPPLLQELKMNDNGLQGLHRHSFRGLYKLLTLELEGNHFHDGNVYPLSFKPLRSLIYLRLDRNQFRAVPSGLPPSLQELHLDSNRIEQVSEGLLNKTLDLSVLVLSSNRLQEDRIATRAWIDLPKLESLDLSYNRLVHVPSFLPRGLRQLTLHHNQIERIPGYVFAHMKPGLEFLHLSHNHLREDGIHAVSFLGLYKSLAELLLDNNRLHAVPRGILNLKALQVLRLSFNKIRYVPLNSICDTRVSVDSSLISVHLENNLIDRRLIPPTAFSCIKTYYSVVLRPQQNEDEDY